MPHIKMARKSTDTDMTPFVDVAFLILSFFIMATQFKPPEPVQVETPNSVSSDILKEENSMLITVDKDNKVFININEKKGGHTGKLEAVISDINQSRNLGLSQPQMTSFTKAPIIGVSFTQLKDFLNRPLDEQGKVVQPGIPVLDTLNNELVWWIASVKK